MTGAGGAGGNARNGNTAKAVQTGVGPVPLQVPRDRAGTFEPVLVPKRSGRVAGGLDDMVISLYAHDMSVRDIIATCGRSTRPSCRPRRSLGLGHVRPAQPRSPRHPHRLRRRLDGFAAAITAAFPAPVVQRCVVHYADLRVMPTSRRDLQVAA